MNTENPALRRDIHTVMDEIFCTSSPTLSHSGRGPRTKRSVSYENFAKFMR